MKDTPRIDINLTQVRMYKRTWTRQGCLCGYSTKGYFKFQSKLQADIKKFSWDKTIRDLFINVEDVFVRVLCLKNEI